MSSVLAASRAWVWPVLAGFVLGAYLLAHAARRVLAVLPEEVRAGYTKAWQANWRPIATTGVVLGWTLVYALYSMSLPVLGDIREVSAPAAQEAEASGTSVPPAVTAEPSSTVARPPASRTGPTSTPSPTAPAAADGGAVAPPPAVDPGGPDAPEPAPCSVQGAADAVADAQAAAEALTGRPVGADLSLVVAALAGCGDAEGAALSLLGPINQLLNDAKVPLLELPDLPQLELPTIPEAIAGPLRPVVFELCARVTPQLLTVVAVAPVARISADDALRVLQYVTAVCRSFSPAEGDGS